MESLLECPKCDRTGECDVCGSTGLVTVARMITFEEEYAEALQDAEDFRSASLASRAVAILAAEDFPF